MGVLLTAMVSLTAVVVFRPEPAAPTVVAPDPIVVLETPKACVTFAGVADQFISQFGDLAAVQVMGLNALESTDPAAMAEVLDRLEQLDQDVGVLLVKYEAARLRCLGGG
jgi:hypothetical protein